MPDDAPHIISNMTGAWFVGAIDIPAIVDDVAARLGITTEAADNAVQAAVDFICDDTGVAPVDLPADDPRLIHYGIPLLAMRMAQDVPNQTQQLNEYDPNFGGVFLPLWVGRRLDNYWSHLRVGAQIGGIG